MKYSTPSHSISLFRTCRPKSRFMLPRIRWDSRLIAIGTLVLNQLFRFLGPFNQSISKLNISQSDHTFLWPSREGKNTGNFFFLCWLIRSKQKLSRRRSIGQICWSSSTNMHFKLGQIQPTPHIYSSRDIPASSCLIHNNRFSPFQNVKRSNRENFPHHIPLYYLHFTWFLGSALLSTLRWFYNNHTSSNRLSCVWCLSFPIKHSYYIFLNLIMGLSSFVLFFFVDFFFLHELSLFHNWI